MTRINRRVAHRAAALAVGTTAALAMGRALDSPEVRVTHSTPEWAQGAVWYQILPERFRNGEPKNDPRGLDVCLLAWSSPWIEVGAGETERLWAREASTGTRADPQRSMLARGIHRRRYGGDLQGVVSMLPWLRAMGVDVVYLTPIFDSGSLHKYDASDHRHVDPTLGGDGGGAVDVDVSTDPTAWPWTRADRYLVDELIPQAHALGIRIVLDGVWNHVGVDHWAFADVLRRGSESPFAGWFRVRFDEHGRARSWMAWDGPNGGLPEFQQTAGGDLSPAVKRHVFDVTRRWMDPDGDGDPGDGIDGWRLDVVPEIGLAFWRDWCAHARAINPECVLVAEVWEPGGVYLEPGLFDAQMNYPFARAVVPWLTGERSSSWLGDRLASLTSVPGATARAQLNLISSHDTERLASMLEHPGRTYDSSGDRAQPAAGADVAAEAPTRDRVRLACALLATYLGSPMVYAGDEWLMTGGDDPYNRAPIPWPDLTPTPGTPGRAPDTEFQRDVGTWLRLRRDPDVGPILRFGDVVHMESGRDDVFAFTRSRHGRVVLVVLNRGHAPFDAAGLLADEVGSQAHAHAVPARSARVFGP